MANLFFGTFNDSRPYCHHGISQFCPLCEDGKNYLKKCSTCGIKIWAGKTEKINHVAGNPLRKELADITWKFRHDITVNQLKNMCEIWSSSVSSKNFYSRYIGNFQSKNLHTIKS